MDSDQAVDETATQALGDRDMLRRDSGGMRNGEVMLRLSLRRAEKLGLAEHAGLLRRILSNREDIELAAAILEDETGSGGGLLRDILAAIWADPEKFINLLKQLIELLEGVFAGPAPVT